METLPSWSDGPAKEAIVRFVDDVTRSVPEEERVAVFDNDGTLWCEKPMPIELGFVLERLDEMVESDATLGNRQPWKAAHEQDHAWLSGVVTNHYAGDDTDLKVLLGGILQAFAGWSVEEYAEAAEAFLDRGEHPSLGRSFRDCGYRPMVELLEYLEANGFTSYIASAGDRDFMRPIAKPMYGVPFERVIGSSNALRYEEDDGNGKLVYLAEPDVFDDGPTKPVRIWSRIGRRPILAAGNANGDLPMLRFAGGPSRPALRLLLMHDDDEREFAYTAGAEKALEAAAAHGWTVISVKKDWATVFA